MCTKLSTLSASLLLAVAGAAIAPSSALACGDGAYMGQICIMASTYCPENTAEANGQMLPINSNQVLFALLGCVFGGDCKTTFALPDLRGRAPVGYGQGPGLFNHEFGTKFGNEYVTMSQAQMPIHNHAANFTPGGGTGGGGTASGTVSIPVTGTVSGVSVSSLPNLTASTSGTVKLANTAGGGAISPSAGNVLTTSPAGRPYVAASSSDFALGGTQTFTGPVTGAINNTVTGGTVSGTASGTVSLPVTGGGGGGTVTVDNTGGSRPMATVPPELAIRYCIVTYGLFPPRP